MMLFFFPSTFIQPFTAVLPLVTAVSYAVNIQIEICQNPQMCFHQSDGIVKIEAVNVFFRQQCSQQIVLGAVEAGVDAPLRSSHGSATATCGQKHFAT